MYTQLKRKHSSVIVLLLLSALTCFIAVNKAYAVSSHPLGVLSYEYAGHINTLSIGGSLRAGNDASANKCAMNLSSSANLAQAVRDPANIALTGLPAGATVIAAHLYWVGDFDPDPAVPLDNSQIPPVVLGAASTSFVPDYNVLFNGTPIASSKNMTDSFIYTLAAFTGGSHQFDFFGGYADVTTQVAATGNALYTLSGLTVNTAGYHCAINGVVSGWALHVVYSSLAEPFRVVKFYDGFQIYRGSKIQLIPNGFTTPTATVPTGKIITTTWEGDEANSAVLLGFTEDLKINVLPSTIPNTSLTNALNPIAQQFNGTVNTTNPPFPLLVPPVIPVVGGAPAPWGVDVDHYDITAQLSPGQTSLATEYSSGSDLVILSSEVVVVENVPIADIAISKTHVGDFGVGLSNNYTLSVSNVGVGIGNIDEPGPITVTDTLPAGLNYVSASGTGWTCSYAGTLSCTHPGPLVKGTTLPPITLTVTAPTAGTVTNTATVAGAGIDNIQSNNTSSDVTNIINPPILTVVKMASATTANPGANITYTVQVKNTGLGAATAVSQDDRLSKYTSFGVECMAPGVSIVYADGAPASTLVKGTPLFSNNNGATFNYIPPSLGSGICTYDPNITTFRLPMTGTMPSLGTYSLQYKVQVK
jgi:uncharacterized repeat protein (TIGR01451 family)